MEKKKRPGLLTAYAKHAGISKQAASKQLERVGIQYLEEFDFAEADRRREAARHADRAQFVKTTYASDDQEDAPPSGAIVTDPAFAESQSRREMFKAKLAELEYLELVGVLVRKDKVEEETFRKWRVARDKMLNLVSRIYHDLAAETDPVKVKQKLIVEIRQAMESVAIGDDPWKEVA
jgi:hypothetical protein